MIKCPVNVEVYALDGTLITTLVDGIESDVSNSYGRFSVVYRSYADDYAKVVCLNQDGDYTVKLCGVEEGLVDTDFATTIQGKPNVYGFRDVAVTPNTVIQTSVQQIVDTSKYQIDLDRDGVFEETGNFLRSGVDIASWTAGDQKTVVSVSDPDGVLENGAVIYAAVYEDGRMTSLLSGSLSGRTLTFGGTLSADWTIFFLDPTTLKPLCKVITLK